MAQDDGKFYLSTSLLEATHGCSLGSIGVLMDLIMIASQSGSSAIPVNDKMLAEMVKTRSDRRNVRKWFDELIERKLVTEVEPGRYLIAPDLWAMDVDTQ